MLADQKHGNIDTVVKPALTFLSVCVAALVALIVVFLIIESWPILSELGLSVFVANDGWYPLEGRFGLLPMIVASVLVMLGATLIAVPFGVGLAIFVSFYAPNLMAKSYRLILNLLAGIPSVVFGLWGLTQLVPLVSKWQPPGASIISAILVLSIMILPTVSLTSIAAINAVPKDLLMAASALGMNSKAKVLGVVLPAAKSGIMSGSLLATARALGETMAVLMVAGNVVQFPTSVFDPVRVLTANIALEMAYAADQHRASLFASGLFLTALVLMLAWLASKFSVIPRR